MHNMHQSHFALEHLGYYFKFCFLVHYLFFPYTSSLIQEGPFYER